MWSLEKANHVYGYFKEVLRLNGGQFEGLPFVLRLWQAFIVGSLFGWLTATDGYRRFRTGFVEVGKGNGKSPLAAGIGLYCLTSDNEARAEVYAAASTLDQALVLFRDAVAMRDQSPLLTGRLIKYGGLKPSHLFYPHSDSFFRTISADDKQSGPRPSCGLCDEVHEHYDGTVIEMLHAGLKFRRQPLILEITNSGVDRNTICYQHHEYSERILNKRQVDDSWFAYICALKRGDSWKDEKVWPKANPNLGVSIDMKYLRAEVTKAKGMPASASKVRRLNFCEWVDAATPWIDGDEWRACEVPNLDLAKYRGSRCWAGLDLSSRNDLTALALVFLRPDGAGYDAFLFFWSPAEGLRLREDRDKVPYTLWRDEGYIEVTPGASVDYEYVARRIIDFRETYGLEVLGFDRYRIADLQRHLDDAGFEYSVLKKMEVDEKELALSNGLWVVPHGQGFRDMTPAVEEISNSVVNHKLRVRWNPALTMCSANAVVTTDAAESKKFDKRKSKGRIDGIVALSMALRCAEVFKSHDGAGSAGNPFTEL